MERRVVELAPEPAVSGFVVCQERLLTMHEMLGKLVALIVTVPSEMLGALCDLAEKLASQRGSEWYEQLVRFLRREPCWGPKVFLRECFVGRGAIRYRLVANGTFLEIFGSLGADRRRWTDAQQVVAFCHDHPEVLHLGGYANFFESGDAVMVQITAYAGGKIEAEVFSLFEDGVRYAESLHSFIVPL